MDSMTGQPPAVSITPSNPEQAKYLKLWGEFPQYRGVAPGEGAAGIFLQQARPPAGSDVIDFGAGTGRGALMLAAMGAMRVTMLDFASNCLDPEVAECLQSQPQAMSFLQHDLTRPVPVRAAYGFCTDVMEHIPPDDVRKVLANILGAAERVFFQVSLVDDVMGALIGAPLHLTVKPAAWWLQELQELGAVVTWAHSDSTDLQVLCSTWGDAGEIIGRGRINVGNDAAMANVRANLAAGWQNVKPHDLQDREVILLAGGPSMLQHVDEIRELRAAGAALVTVNGAFDWAISQGLTPSMQVVLDARPFNARFTRTVLPRTVYMMASQVHPDTLEGLPKDRTYLWHSGLDDATEALVRDTTGACYYVPGGSTVVLRAIPLLRMLGFANIHIFGFDSCVAGDRHHAYDQAENDAEPTFPVTCGGRTFRCTSWQMSQAAEFRDLVKFLGDLVSLNVVGDGLIAHMINHAASFAHSPLILE